MVYPGNWLARPNSSRNKAAPDNERQQAYRGLIFLFVFCLSVPLENGLAVESTGAL